MYIKKKSNYQTINKILVYRLSVGVLSRSIHVAVAFTGPCSS